MDTYLIWSHEHGAFWGPGRCGYVNSVAKAGRYSRAEAIDICANSIPGTSRWLHALPELPVREADAIEMRDRFRAAYPGLAPEAWE